MLKKWILVFCILQIGILTNIKADDTYWDTQLVRQYVHNSELQRRWAVSFLAPYLLTLKGDEKILDIGCGDGKITADVSKFIPQGTIEGIDPSFPMITWAKKQYSLLEYPNLQFFEGGFLEPNRAATFDIVISNCAMQHCEDQLQAFKSVKNLLKEDGKLLIMVPAMNNSAWKKARQLVQTSPKWSIYWKNILPRKFLSVDEYRQLLITVGFDIKRLENIETIDRFVDKEELLSFLLGTMTPAVPTDLAKEFYDELIETYLELLPDALNENGSIEVRFGRIEIEAIKI